MSATGHFKLTLSKEKARISKQKTINHLRPRVFNNDDFLRIPKHLADLIEETLINNLLKILNLYKMKA